MAIMNWRIGNEARILGVRPGHNGSQIFHNAIATNARVILYTVPSGKTLYLCETTVRTDSNVTGWCYVHVRDITDTFVRVLCMINVIANVIIPTDHNHFWPPVEIPENYTIAVESNTAGLNAYGSIFGWEE